MQCCFLLNNSTSRQCIWRTCAKRRGQALQEASTARGCDGSCHSIAIGQSVHTRPNGVSIPDIERSELLTKCYDLGIEGRPRHGLWLYLYPIWKVGYHQPADRGRYRHS